ncbi:LANO_0H20428g1_1 [Lachancea nothofagi CBS 11611]|uniref:SURF1-like protein n=1 Tax=Lachancea nothofagi CBS 11611 TaxID=1266666 RepID=A0A1G4KN97_9SACH|nr:LANO_0H20428g1_1 [Lachancea nothofagi CBS 11611]
MFLSKIRQDVLTRSAFRVRSRMFLNSPKRSVTSSVDWKPIKSTKTPNDKSENSSFTRMIFLGLMIAMPVVSFYLGSWQLRRLKWKTNLIATCEDRLTYPASPLPKDFPPEEAENWEYRKVKITGEFKHDQELFVGPRVRNGIKGYLLFTPFVRQDTGEILLIERGWISDDKVVPTKRSLHHLSLPTGNIEIECLVRVAKKLGTFQWDKEDRDSRLWQIIDIPDMCAASGATPLHLQSLYDLKDHNWAHCPNDVNPSASTSSKPSKWKFWQRSSPQVQSSSSSSTNSPISDDAEFNEWQLVKSGVPVGKTPKIDLKNNHLQYLVTWYGLSFLSTIFLIVALKRNRGGAVSQAQLKKDKLRHAKKYM